jgi:imidazole glycerol-phosphate synthase subunit HisF
MLFKRLVPKLVVVSQTHTSDFVSVLTQSYHFKRVIGSVLSQCRIFDSNLVDEIVIVNKSHVFNNDFVDLVNLISRNIQTPLSVGGSISILEHGQRLIQAGADKIILGESRMNRSLANRLAENHGSQALVFSLDYNENELLKNPNFFESQITWANENGFGEILLNNIDRDGTKMGLDIERLKTVRSLTKMPIMMGCGVGKVEHIRDAFFAGSNAVASSTFLATLDQSPKQIRSHLNATGVHIRYLN